jgi:phosphomannomutase/phosphoglucomutase
MNRELENVKNLCNTIRSIGGWILLRPSGTEPLYRCFVESTSKELATDLSENGRALVEKAIEQA